MKVYCRPGATPFERLEAHIAFHLRCRPEVCRPVGRVLSDSTGKPETDGAWGGPLPSERIENPAEALGAARAILLLCGVAAENQSGLTGNPREDFARLLEGRYGRRSLAAPEAYAVPSLVNAYCHMGASFARGVDRVFQAVTGQPLAEHLNRAFKLLEQAS